MTTIIANKYEILSKIGEGSFGKVFKGKHILTGEEFAIKIQHKDIEHVLKHEAKIYKYLHGINGVPLIRNYGTDSGFNYLILDYINISLDKTILTHENITKYFINAINIIENIHNKGVLHRDIKPDNFMLKENNGTTKLYIIDFGLAKIFLSDDKKHIEERNDKKLVGTVKYASINLHNGIEPSRRDDMESLCYTFISIYKKSLLWDDDIEEYYKKSIDKREDISYLHNKILEKKLISLEWLYDIPGEFITILLYLRRLKFSERPNYKYLRGLLENLLEYLISDI